MRSEEAGGARRGLQLGAQLGRGAVLAGLVARLGRDHDVAHERAHALGDRGGVAHRQLRRVDAVEDRRGVGRRRGLGLLQPGAHLVGGGRAQRLDLGLREPVLAQPRGQPLHRVALCGVVGELLLIHVAAVVVRRVPVEAQRHGLDRARPAAGSRLLDRRAQRDQRRDRVAAVDAARGDAPAALDAVGHAGVDHLAARRRRVGIAVRLQHEDGRHLQHGGQVEALVDVAGAHRAVAPERQRDARLAPPLERQGGADGHGAEVAEHRDEREDAALRRTPKCMLPSRPRVGESPLPRKLRKACGRGDPAREMAGELAVERARRRRRGRARSPRRRRRPPARGRCRPSPRRGRRGRACRRAPRSAGA